MDGASGAGTPELEVRLLGPLEVTRAGDPVPLGGAKPRTLLAVLALELGHVVSVDRLVEALWPGDPPETAGHAVQVYVSQLRKALGPVIATRATGYELDLGPERVDIHRFTRLAQAGRMALDGEDFVAAEGALREALALWRGAALTDFLYDPFAQSEIARLEEMRTVVLEERIDADLALGRHAELVSELEALVSAQPLRERPRAQLMLALYRSGRQADALGAYRAAREALVGELGIEPGPELRELQAAILRQDESLLLDETSLARPAMQFRRLASILFCDVVDSMAIAEELDPEALARVQSRYFETVGAVIMRHGGTVEKYAGDAVMAAFGIPIAHEDHALRAARAAVEIRTGVSALATQLEAEYGFGLEVRVGLAAGEVVSMSTDGRQRFVAGDAVGVAARLEHAAEPGEILVGELVARLIDHAARLEPLGELTVKSRKAPIGMFRLAELLPVAPTFAGRMDVPLVGRKRELAALRRSLKRALDSGSPRAAVVIAPPGLGKSRLAAEFTRRAKNVTALWGRCLSYGDGITYWPLREVLAGAGESAERDAVLAALEADTPPPAPELAFLFRRFCEASARERPLVLVFDDVHWAEPTFLELVEHLADKGEAPIHVICLAREELAESRASFLEGRANVDRIEPAPLTAVATQSLVDALGGTILESDQRTRLVETAEGNPLFLEQLLALALEGGLGADPLPETIEALLAARLDRLGPGERAVLERGAVVGKEFTADDVVALLDADAAPTADAHLSALAGRGFVRPRGGGVFGFRHVLVQEAVYRAAPKRLRAELHERYADRLDETSPDLAELDEFVGYHLERAYRLRTELGESDRRVERLAQDGGRRLGDAGLRAVRRGDVPAANALLGRATSMLAPTEPVRGDLLCELGITTAASGDPGKAITLLQQAVDEAVRIGDRRVEVRAVMELEYVRLPQTPGATADALLRATLDAIPVLEAAADYRCLGRAWLLAGWVHGGRRAQHEERERAAEKALRCYQRSNWPTSICAGEIANALYYGPTPVDVAIGRCEELIRTETGSRHGRAVVEAYLGGLVAQRGEVDDAYALLRSARETYDELGQRGTVATFVGALLGDVALLADDPEAAEDILRWVCAELERTHAYSRLASRAADLAEALYRQARYDEAAQWVELAALHSAPDDLDARVLWMPVKAKLLARRGDSAGSLRIASDAVSLAESSDGLNRHANACLCAAEASRLVGRGRDSADMLHRAIEIFEAKGNESGATRARTLSSATLV